MKSLTILGVLALFLLLVLPGAVMAADVSVSGSVVDEDLVVTAISPNVGVGAAFFANEPNVISVTVTNSGGLDAGASTVEVVVGTDTYTAAVPAITAGGFQTVTVTDTVSRTYASGPVSVTATADSAGVIAESDETNNAMTTDLTIYYNGYKGKRYTDGSDIVTYKTFNLRGDVLYSTGDSVYFSGSSTPWTTYTTNWAGSDLPVPGTAVVEEARLYVIYTWDKNGNMPDDISLTFNSEAQTLAAHYTDRKNFGTSNHPYGTLAYDVTEDFSTTSNVAILTNAEPLAGNPSIRGMLLVVIYEDGTETEKQIIVNEEFDLLYGGSASGTTPDEATAYATFGALDTSGVGSATLITFAPGAGNPSEGDMLYNGAVIATNVWNYAGTSQIGVDSRDVTSLLSVTTNDIGFQSSADYMEASNAILVLEQTEAAVTADFTPATQVSGDKPFTVNFDSSSSTGYITSYAWTFEGTENTDYQFVDGTSATSANPHVEYLTRGTYDVSLEVTGVGSSDTAAKTDLVVVKEPAPVIDFTIDPASGVEPLYVDFDATNTGGTVDSWNWEYRLTTDTTWTSFAATEDTSHTFTDGTYDIRLTATGPDYTDVETKTAAVTVGESSIVVTVSPDSIDFGTMAAGVDEEGATTVSVDVTGGTAWTVTASATNGGSMMSGTTPLANLFEISNDGKVNYYTLDDNLEFLTGAAGVDGSQVADVKQAIAAADAPGAYSITLTFTSGMA